MAHQCIADGGNVVVLRLGVFDQDWLAERSPTLTRRARATSLMTSRRRTSRSLRSTLLSQSSERPTRLRQDALRQAAAAPVERDPVADAVVVTGAAHAIKRKRQHGLWAPAVRAYIPGQFVRVRPATQTFTETTALRQGPISGGKAVSVQGPFKVDCREQFPHGLGVVGAVTRWMTSTSRRKDNHVQARDKETGLPVWVVEVMDFDPEARERTFKVKIAAAVQPVPPAGSGGRSRPSGGVGEPDGDAVASRARTVRGRRLPTPCGAPAWPHLVAQLAPLRRRRDHMSSFVGRRVAPSTVRVRRQPLRIPLLLLIIWWLVKKLTKIVVVIVPVSSRHDHHRRRRLERVRLANRRSGPGRGRAYAGPGRPADFAAALAGTVRAARLPGGALPVAALVDLSLQVARHDELRRPGPDPQQRQPVPAGFAVGALDPGGGSGTGPDARRPGHRRLGEGS